MAFHLNEHKPQFKGWQLFSNGKYFFRFYHNQNKIGHFMNMTKDLQIICMSKATV